MKGFTSFAFVCVVVVMFGVAVFGAIAQEPLAVQQASATSQGVSAEVAPAQQAIPVAPAASVIPTELTVKVVQDPPKVIYRDKIVRVPVAEPVKPMAANKGVSAPLWVWIVLCAAVLAALLCCAYLLGYRRQPQQVVAQPIVVTIGGAPAQAQPVQPPQLPPAANH